MSTNYTSEFSRLFSNGCSVKNTDWNKERYFDTIGNDCYKSEAALISELTSEAYGNFGFEVQYYVKKVDVHADRLFGEDPLENVERRFKLQMYTDSIPTMQKSYELQGMIYNEIITCQCTIQHFYDASQLSYPELEDIYEPIEPRIGDIVYIEYSDTYYEVINVKPFGDGSTFLSTPITYTFSLRIWHNNHEDIDAPNLNPDKMDEFKHYAELAETFNIDTKSDTVEHTSIVDAKSDILSTNNIVKQNNDEHENFKPNNNSKLVPEQDKIIKGDEIIEPTDNVHDHAIYKSSESKEDNPQYYDPFGGF